MRRTGKKMDGVGKRANLFVVCWDWEWSNLLQSSDEHDEHRVQTSTTSMSFRFTFNPRFHWFCAMNITRSGTTAKARGRSRDTHEWNMDRSGVVGRHGPWMRMTLPLTLMAGLKFSSSLDNMLTVG